MAITDFDGVIAGYKGLRPFLKAASGTLVAGRAFSYWGVAGIPGPGGYNGTLNGVVLESTSNTVAGMLRHIDPGSGNAYLGRFGGGASQAGMLVLADRLWHNGGITITSTSSQAITSPTWPARDADGATNGEGVYLGLEVSATTGTGTPTITVGYTNSAGTAGRTGTNIVATTASTLLGTCYWIGQQGVDTGVRSVQSLQLSASWTSGTINLVAFRILEMVETAAAFVGNWIDVASGGLERLYNGVVPYLQFIPQTTTSTNIVGSYLETHG